MANARTKKASKVDYDKAFEARQAKLAGAAPKTDAAKDVPENMSKAAKGMILEQAAEENLADQLFGTDDAPAKVTLSSEKEYKSFGTKVSKTLLAGNAPYHIEKFFKELSKDLPEHCNSKQLKSIADNLMLIYNNKLKAEKAEDKNVKKKAAVLKGGGGKGYDRNNNAAMINDVMGGDDEDDYGQESGFRREEEAEYDFM